MNEGASPGTIANWDNPTWNAAFLYHSRLMTLWTGKTMGHLRDGWSPVAVHFLACWPKNAKYAILS